MGLLLSCDLVKVGADEPEFNATFVSVFTDKISWASDPRDRIQGREDLAAVEEDQVRDLLRYFDPYKSVYLGRGHPGHKERWLIPL